MGWLRILHAKCKWLFHSLFVRIIVCALFVMLLGSTFRYFYVQYKLGYIFEHVAIQQQKNLVENFAQEITQKVVLRQQVLQALAIKFPLELVTNPAQLELWLKANQTLLAPLFSELLIEIPSGQGMARYSSTANNSIRLSNVLSLNQNTLANRLNEPDINFEDLVPELIFKQTINNTEGHPWIILRGASVLTLPSLLGEMTGYKNGQTGGFLLVPPNARHYITFEHAKLETHEIPAKGVFPLLDKILDGALDSDTATRNIASNKQDARNVFSAVAVIPSTRWIVAAYLPDAEVILPFHQLVQDGAKIIPIITVLFTLLAACIMFYFLRPLTLAAKYAEKMTRGEIPLAPLPLGNNDELGALTRSFNRLINNLSDNAKELTEQREIAEIAAASKSRFLAAASHDLRQPMHALNLYLGALAHFDLQENARSALINARECAQTMDDMFRALLDISKLDAHVVDINISIFPISQLLDKIRKEYTPQAEAKGLRLHVAACSAYVSSDPELLERILRNLVSNAVRYTSSGKILVGCRRSETGLQLHVYDTGAGIAADHQKAIFEEFYQASNPGRDREQGLGLGLAIVQRLALLLQSPLQLTSQVGRGSVFSVGLERAYEYIPTQEQIEDESSQMRTLEGALVAVVDDEILILNATSMLMKQWGCSVISAVSGTELFELLAVSTRVPDALVCDYRLRDGETGIGVIDLLRDEFNTDIPALLITGDTSRDQIQIMLAAEIPILHKPLQDHALKAALINLINKQPT